MNPARWMIAYRAVVVALLAAIALGVLMLVAKVCHGTLDVWR